MKLIFMIRASGCSMTPSVKLPGRILFACLISACGALPASSQTPAGNTAKPRLAEADFEAERLRRVATAIRVTEKITLDGRLDEPGWKLSVPMTDFIQRIPRTGEQSDERTEVRVLYDDHNLYVGVSAFDSRPAPQLYKHLPHTRPACQSK